ncbi:OmpA family protein [Croceiramulus getboli]|nr:OmpA family protein [Flavobacteriaceae bacterium YJPT1-3]
MMKTIYILLACVLVQTLGAQNSLSKADKLFASKAFYEAAALYEEETEKSQQVLQNLADSYYYYNEGKKAYDTYTQLFDAHDDIDSEYYFRYAETAKLVGDLDKASELLTEYTGAPVNLRDHYNEVRKSVPHRFDTQMVNRMAPESDFGATYFDRQIVFASTRNIERPIYGWNGEPFLDLYYGKVSGTTLTDVGLFPGEVNTDAHESSPAFHPNGTTMYFTRNSDKKVRIGREKVGVLQIMKADLVAGQWTNIEPVSFAGDKFNTAHPTVNRDGTRLYFSSDMEGGFGSYDIYEVAINADGSFGEVRNLGEAVNSKEREQFPFISDRNHLYFTRTGPMTFGGMDIYASEWQGDAFAKAYNMGPSINTPYDDFAFIVKEGSASGYFSSNRSGQDKLQIFTRRPNTEEEYIVEGVVQDKNSEELLPGSLVTLFDNRGNVLQDTIVKEDARYIFKTEPNRKYVVRGTRKLYIPYDVAFETDQEGNISHNIYLTLESYADAEKNIEKDELTQLTQVKLEKIYFDFDKSAITEKAANTLDDLVALMKKYPEMEIEVASHTDARGPADYNLALSKRRAQSTMDYLISQGIEASRLKSIGYGEMQPLNNCTEPGMCTEEEYDLNRRSEFTILK